MMPVLKLMAASCKQTILWPKKSDPAFLLDITVIDV